MWPDSQVSEGDLITEGIARTLETEDQQDEERDVVKTKRRTLRSKNADTGPEGC